MFTATSAVNVDKFHAPLRSVYTSVIASSCTSENSPSYQNAMTENELACKAPCSLLSPASDVPIVALLHQVPNKPALMSRKLCVAPYNLSIPPITSARADEIVSSLHEKYNCNRTILPSTHQLFPPCSAQLGISTLPSNLLAAGGARHAVHL